MINSSSSPDGDGGVNFSPFPSATTPIVFPESINVVKTISVFKVASKLLPLIYELKKKLCFHICFVRVEKYLKKPHTKPLWKLKKKVKSTIESYRKQSGSECGQIFLDMQLILELFYCATLGRQRVEREIKVIEHRIFVIWIVWLLFYEHEGEVELKSVEEIPSMFKVMGRSLHRNCITRVPNIDLHFKQLLEFTLKDHHVSVK